MSGNRSRDRRREFNNEPALSKDYCVEFSCKLQTGGEAYFTTCAMGLYDISDCIYDQLCSRSGYFSETVSQSMFAYYCAQMYYIRIAVIELSHGNPSPDVRTSVDYSRSDDWIMPKLLSDYLHSIGDFEDSMGVIARHREIVLPNDDPIKGVRGYYGQVTKDTHSHYENRPTPGVICQRICEDIRMTVLQNDDSDNWDIPDELRPEEPYYEGPTANMLGWRPAARLWGEQLNVLRRCGIDYIDEPVFPSTTCFRFNYDLVVHIDRMINELRSRIKCSTGFAQSSHGSISQQDFQTMKPMENAKPNFSCLYAVNSYDTNGLTQLDRRQELMAQASRFRMRKDSMPSGEGCMNTWCCYRFNNYLDVPDTWFDTRNMYFNYGGTKAWDFATFQSNGESAGFLIKLMSGKMLK